MKKAQIQFYQKTDTTYFVVLILITLILAPPGINSAQTTPAGGHLIRFAEFFIQVV